MKNSLILVICVVFFASCSGVGGISVRKPIQITDNSVSADKYLYALNESKDYKKASEILEISCENEPKSCEKLGNLYLANLLGAKINFNADLQKASKYYEKACQKGYCAGVGFLYDNGLKYPKNTAKANELYQSSCEKGDMQACELLGLAYAKKDEIFKAKEYLELACDSDTTKCVGLGAYYSANFNNAKASQIFEKSCNAGDISGCVMLGNEFIKKKQLEKAKNALLYACSSQDFAGCQSLGVVYQMLGNNKNAKKYFEISCKKGDKKSCQASRI